LVAAVGLTLMSGVLGWAQPRVTSSEDQAYAGEADQSLKQAMAESILAERESKTGRAFDPAYRHSLRRRMASRSIEDLRAWLADPDPAIPGGASVDLTYTPVNPCRIIDTRVAGGAITSATRRAFHVAGDASLGSQGGSPSGCNVPYGPATAVMVNIAATQSTGAGNLRAFAWASPEPPTPNAVVLNYGVVSGLNAIANGIAVPICGGGCSFDLFIYASTTTHVVADVVGYFARSDANILADYVTKPVQTIGSSTFTELLQATIALPDKCIGVPDHWTVLITASGNIDSASAGLISANFGLSRNSTSAIQADTFSGITLATGETEAWHVQGVFTDVDAGLSHDFRVLAASPSGGTSYRAVDNKMVLQVLGNNCP
jgi:hypothetical protein